MAGRTLLVISATLDQQARDAVAGGRWPRKDFLELQRLLDADVVDYATPDSRRRWRLLRRVAGAHLTLAWIAFSRRGSYDRIFTDGEHLGIPLALLLRLSRARVRHVTIGHLLTTPLKRALFRFAQPQRRIDALVVHAGSQARSAAGALAASHASLAIVPYGVDAAFWRPAAGVAHEPVICAAGLEYRDYATLVEAVRGLPVRLVIAAGSRWSTHRGSGLNGDLPPNVEVCSLDYPALRALYQRSRFVVVPLRDVDNQAGITTILEAMAMGRAVIASATRGQRDTLRGRLVTAAAVTEEVYGGPSAFGVKGRAAAEETGLYVTPGDQRALRRAILHLLAHPAQAQRMGAAGRRLVEEVMHLDAFAGRVAALVNGAATVLPDAPSGGYGGGARPPLPRRERAR